jgi:ABC-type multidrug transport system permease subunit
LTLLHLNLLLLTVGCLSLSVGFAARERRCATAAMLAGILCILFMIGYDIHRLVAR